MKPTETRHRSFARPGAPGSGAEPIERELVALFRSLPEVRPRAGFADRVMARISRPSWFARPAVRILVAAAVAFAALSAALLLPAAGAVVGWIGPGGAVAFVTDGFADLAVRFASGLAAWEPLSAIGRAVARVVALPRVAVLVFAQFAIAALALRGLAALAASTRRTAHVAS
jgi:hypothetical protein